MEHLLRWDFKLPNPNLQSIVSHYEFIEFGDGSLCNTDLLYLPNFNNAFLFYKYKEDPILTDNLLTGKAALPSVSLIPPVSIPTYNREIKNLSAIRVIFQPGILWKMFGIPMNEFTNISLGLVDIFDKEFLFVEEALNENACYEKQIEIIESYILKKIFRIRVDKNLFVVLDEFLSKNNYEVTNNAVAKSIGITSRHLRRLVGKEFGYTVREFINIHRTNKIIDILQDTNIQSLTEIAYKFGYFDQSHFIREFKRRTFSTPSSYLKKLQDEKLALSLMQGKKIKDENS